MEKIKQLEENIQRIKEEMVQLGAMRPGSLSVQQRKWGGDYLQLSYSHKGKGHTLYIRGEERTEVEEQIANYKRFRELIREWVDLAVELARLRTKANDTKSSRTK